MSELSNIAFMFLITGLLQNDPLIKLENYLTHSVCFNSPVHYMWARNQLSKVANT